MHISLDSSRVLMIRIPVEPDEGRGGQGTEEEILSLPLPESLPGSLAESESERESEPSPDMGTAVS